MSTLPNAIKIVQHEHPSAHDEHAAQLKEQLRLDYIERFGREPPPEEEQAKDDIKAKPSKQQVTFWLQSLKKEYAASNPGGLKTCLNTLKLYMSNARNNVGRTCSSRDEHCMGRVCMGIEGEGRALHGTSLLA